MGKTTISFFEFRDKFPNSESARLYLEEKRWDDKPVCPHCGCIDRQYKQSRSGKEGYYFCFHCKLTYTVRTGTIFERSHVDLDKWLFAIYSVVTSRKGISSLQLSKLIGVEQRTAWFMLQRIREACKDDILTLKGIVEIDEAYIGGLEKNKHASKKIKAGGGIVGKIPVLGMRERNGNFKGKVIKDTKTETIQCELNNTLLKDTTICTDEHRAYIDTKFTHLTVNHSAKQFVDGMAHTNGIESVWAVLKRGFYGIYHSFSEKHLQKYIDEFAYRLNQGNVKIPVMDRINSLLNKCIGKRLMYTELVA